jgi:hypothetical protein
MGHVRDYKSLFSGTCCCRRVLLYAIAFIYVVLKRNSISFEKPAIK